jgi:cullin 1
MSVSRVFTNQSIKAANSIGYSNFPRESLRPTTSKRRHRTLSKYFNLTKVTTYQIAILLLYNTSLEYTWEDIVQSTGMSPDALVGQVGILVKAKVLIAEGSVGKASSKYSLNTDFKSKKIRVNLNIAVKSEQKQESDETHKTIEEDRKLLIQAAIVRIMKTRKALKHVVLMQEVISQLQSRFKPQVHDIKKCIDILLEKEYIERMEDQKEMYQYVA